MDASRSALMVGQRTLVVLTLLAIESPHHCHNPFTAKVRCKARRGQVAAEVRRLLLNEPPAAPSPLPDLPPHIQRLCLLNIASQDHRGKFRDAMPGTYSLGLVPRGTLSPRPSHHPSHPVPPFFTFTAARPDI